jgi:hypothetical protein
MSKRKAVDEMRDEGQRRIGESDFFFCTLNESPSFSPHFPPKEDDVPGKLEGPPG